MTTQRHIRKDACINLRNLFVKRLFELFWSESFDNDLHGVSDGDAEGIIPPICPLCMNWANADLIDTERCFYDRLPTGDHLVKNTRSAGQNALLSAVHESSRNGLEFPEADLH